MKRQVIEKTATTSARPSAVFDRLIDAASWPEWSGHESGRVLTAVDSPGGVGEVRELCVGRKVSVERVVESSGPRRFSYVLVSGLPLRDYRADVDMEPLAGGGTRITWHSEFYGSNALTGAIYQKGLGRFIAKIVTSLAAHAGSSSTTESSRGAPHRPVT